MIILLFLFSLLAVWLIISLLEDYGYILSEMWQTVWTSVLPRNLGIRRLCVITGFVLVATTFLELPNSYRLNNIITETEIQAPDWIVPIIAFCIPFIVAKIVEFIVSGLKK